MHLNATEQRQQ